MQKLKIFIFVGAAVAAAFMVFGIVSCGKLSPFFSSATTNMKSSTFTGLSVFNLRTQSTYEGGFWKVTPSKITGKVASVFFPISDKEDEGLVVYGFYRPDLADEFTKLLDFDLSTTTRLSGIISKKPGYVGGKASIVLMLYGYFDVYFTHGSTNEVIRFCYGTSDSYQRGDVLRKNLTTGVFEWFDLTNNVWTSTRPNNPVKISFIANFTDPSHPSMKYFPLAAKISSPSSGLDLPASIVDNNTLIFTVDYTFNNTLLFDNITSEAAFSAASMEGLVQRVDMSQNKTNWYSVSGASSNIISCSVSLETTPKKGP